MDLMNTLIIIRLRIIEEISADDNKEPCNWLIFYSHFNIQSSKSCRKMGI